MNWLYLILAFAFLIIIRFIINYFKHKRINQLYTEYNKYLHNRNIEFAQQIEEIKSLFKEAGINDSGVIHQEFMGFGQYANMNISVLDNMMNLREDIVLNIQRKFNEAIGVFKKKYTESLNPIFWLEFLVKLPQYFMDFFGVLPEKVIVKVLLVCYWLFAILLGLKKFEILDYLMK